MVLTLDALRSALWLVFAFAGYWLVDYLARREARGQGVPGDWLEWWLALGALVGGRVGHILATNPALLTSPMNLVRLTDGMSFWGALTGGGVALALGGVRRPRWSLLLASAYAIYLPFGIALAHLPCPLYGACGGKATTGPLAVLLPGAEVARWPSDLYEGLGALVLGGVLLRLSARPQPPGRLAGFFLVCYAVLDAWLAPTRLVGASPAWMGTAVDLLFALIGLAFLAYSLRQGKEDHAPRPDGHPGLPGV
ncbi:Prolipoprotein diacylglyceryl transferase [bacterium HR23]|nr:Prolipoprotein diacylglyceryl transferase [bacterium HR23]